MSARRPSSAQKTDTAVLRSDFAGDPEMTELVEYFLHDLTSRIERMHRAWESSSRNELRALTHQLKGAAGGYGFPSITTSAEELEAALLSDQSDVSALTEKVEALIALCRRATAGS